MTVKQIKYARIGAILILGVLAVAAFYFCPFRLAVVSGPSMTPTLKNGQLLVVDCRYGHHGYAVKRGDIVSFNFHGAKYVKRVYGLPGEVIYQLKTPNEPTLIVPLSQLEKVKRSVLKRRADARIVKVTVPPGQVYLLGDGGMLSVDSREFGPQPQAAIIGRVSPLNDVLKKITPLISVSLNI